MKLAEKEKIVCELKDQISATKGLWFTDFSGLDVPTITRFRKMLKENKMTYKVIKNTLLERALKGTKCEDLTRHIDGPIGMCFGEDIAMGSRILIEFQKQVSLTAAGQVGFSVKKAWLEGKVYDNNEIRAIANIPSREILIGYILATVTASLVNLVSVLKGIVVKGVSVFEEISKSKSLKD